MIEPSDGEERGSDIKSQRENGDLGDSPDMHEEEDEDAEPRAKILLEIAVIALERQHDFINQVCGKTLAIFQVFSSLSHFKCH